jgi:hypothetical protein
MTSSRGWALPTVLVLALALASAPSGSAKGRQAADAQTENKGSNPNFNSLVVGAQQYSDPNGRFSFSAPQNWGRLADNDPEEVTFQSETGDSMRVTVVPLKVEAQAFMAAYVDTYLAVLSQSLTDVKYLGRRDVIINNRTAADFVFSARYGSAPVTCHQVVLVEGDRVLYVTFAGYGRGRDLAEQLFLSSLLTFWVNPTFGGKGPAPASVGQTGAPAFTVAIPEGWGEYPNPQDGSRQFRPPGARETSAAITTFANKTQPNDPLTTITDAFVATYSARLRSLYGPGLCEIRRTERTTLDGESAVRFHYVYVANIGTRRATIALCARGGYIIGVACDAAESGFPLYEKAFESVYTSFKFK